MELNQTFWNKFKPNFFTKKSNSGTSSSGGVVSDGASTSSGSTISDEVKNVEIPREPGSVIVHVYDIFRLNDYITNLGIGVYHTGIEVHGIEYCYGGHPLDYSGIFSMVPLDCSILGAHYAYRTSLLVGYTDFTMEDISTIVETMGTDYYGSRYHLLNKNCHHFSEAFVQILCGTGLPKWINRLASVASKLPFIEKSLRKEWLTPVLPEEYDSNSDLREFESSN